MGIATLVLDHDFTVAHANRRLFGGFVEHLGRHIYQGIFEPDHPLADEDGFRSDVLDLVRELGVTTIRYPGGNFVSGYRWEDGVGPKDQRPRRLDLAWHSIESNQFGLDEFVRWNAKVDSELMLAVNLGTRGLQEAIDLLEYTNVPEGTTFSALRAEHGRPEPYDVTFWCLGNEMDGPWQIGHKSAEDYGKLAAQVARSMRKIDDRLELAVCGSSNRQMPTHGEWERTVLEHTYELVDLISCHAYYQELDGDLASFLASGVDMDDFIRETVATIDHVKAVKRSDHTVNISFDEWNIWYRSRYPHSARPTGINNWVEAPRLLEDVYSVADAVAFGGLLITLLRNADRVHSASLAQLVNVIGPIMTEPGGPAWRQTTFFPFKEAASLSGAEILDARLSGQSHATAQYGDVTSIDAVATFDAARNTTTVFAINRSTDTAIDLRIDIHGGRTPASASATTLWDEDPYACNTLEDQTRVSPARNESLTVGADGTATITLPAVSWTTIEIQH